MFKEQVIVTILSLLASVLGLATQILLAKQFGLSIEIDAYIFSLALPIFISSTIAGGLNYIALPRLASLSDDDGERQGYIISLLLLATMMAVLIAIVGINGVKVLQISSIKDVDLLKNHPELELLINTSWLLASFQLVNSTAITILNACKFHIKASLFVLLPFVGPTVPLIINSNEVTSFVVIAGSLVATIISLIISIYYIKLKILIEIKYYLNFKEMTKLLTASPAAVIALTCFSSWATIDSFCAPLIGPGALSTLAYAQRLLIAAGNIAVIGPITTLTPDLAKFAEAGDVKEFSKLYFKTQFFIFLVSFFLAFTIYCFGGFFVKLLFAHGEMNANDVQQIATTLNNMLPGMVAMLMSNFAFRAIYCFPQFYIIGAIIGAVWTLQYYTLCKLLISEGTQGIAFSYDFSWMTTLFLLTLTVKALNKKNSEIAM